MSAMASQITSLTIVYSTVYSSADQRKRQSSASLAFVRAIHRWPVNSLHNGPVTRKMFRFDDVIMKYRMSSVQQCKIVESLSAVKNILTFLKTSISLGNGPNFYPKEWQHALKMYRYISGTTCTNACQSMMTSSNGNIFRVTGHLCGKFTGPRWISHTKAIDAELWCLLWFTPE